MGSLRLVVSLLLLGGCVSRAPKLEPECKLNQDCGLTSIRADCCSGCEARVGNTASLAALNAWCAQKPATACPQLDCSNTAVAPMCVDERCVLRPF